jgi:hypothetical protein
MQKISQNHLRDSAGELKYVSQIKKILHSQLNNPEDDFVKFFASRVYEY